MMWGIRLQESFFYRLSKFSVLHKISINLATIIKLLPAKLHPCKEKFACFAPTKGHSSLQLPVHTSIKGILHFDRPSLHKNAV